MTTTLNLTLIEEELDEWEARRLVERVKRHVGVAASKLRVNVVLRNGTTFVEPFIGGSALYARIATRKTRVVALEILRALVEQMQRHSRIVGVLVRTARRRGPAELPPREALSMAEILRISLHKVKNRWFEVKSRRAVTQSRTRRDSMTGSGPAIIQSEHALELLSIEADRWAGELRTVLNDPKCSWDDIDGPLIYVQLLAFVGTGPESVSIVDPEGRKPMSSRDVATAWRVRYVELHARGAHDATRRQLIEEAFDALLRVVRSDDDPS